ncbi:MAG: hypothetical protein IKG21_03910 [Atopobiaceae bacterium]|nr:hypothetical protein [Atopobiaceae bacterium]
MSLLDTIKGAREEADGNVPFERGGKKEEPEEEVAPKRSGAVRGSAARAKPTREAAAGVRVVKSGGKSERQKKSEAEKANMTKEERKAERKAERAAEREVEDRRYNLTQAYMEENEEYKHARKTWWIFLGVGMALVVVAFTLYGFVNQNRESASPVLAFLSAATMICAYISIIGGLIYDWVKVRPIRQQVQQRVDSMSDKRVRAVLNKKAKEQAEEEKRNKKKK